RIGAVFGERLAHVRAMSGGHHVMRLGRRVGRAEAREVARLLRADARFALVEPDWRMQPLAVPNDTMYAQQWHFHEATGGIRLPAAWDVTTGSSSLTIAVIDTGVLAHADLAGRLVPGHDFVSDPGMSNDGDGRDTNASDPGDHGCNGAASSWHGTHVAGTIGASTGNGAGVAGINRASKLLPVRVLGRCGGYTSDIIDGMRWAAGLAVPGAPANPTPARVLNLSLGADTACSAAFQSAVDEVVARGSVVIAAAGNGSRDVSLTQPANCSGVIAVAATTRSGARAPYRTPGATIAIAAPGGDVVDGVLSTLNTGTTTPGADTYAGYQGTSMAAPHVSGVVSLMLSVAPSLTPAQVLQRLQQAARPFPAGSDCTTWTCGAGIVDAGASVAGLAAPPATGTWTRIASEGQAFTVSGTQTVRYGAGSSWITRSVTSSGVCSNEFFGSDPAVGIGKTCEVSASSPATGTWTWIASEWQSFAVSGTQTVRYGAGSAWITRSVTNGGVCSNEFFGSDPAVGVGKRCEVLSGTTEPAPATGTWTKIANEGQGFSVSGTQTVRYGTGSSWVTRSVAGSGTCSNAFFGTDPAVGLGKQCDVAGTPTTTWTWIASEWQAFTVSGTQTVRYGAGSSWITRSVTSSGVCSNDFFGGDPAHGVGKRCEVASPSR
ncbi:MAG TPA: S8 family peptidase, partial [Albitalea sp.]